MNWNNLNPRQKSEQIIRLLRDMCITDEKVDPSEIQFILEVGTMHGLLPEEIQALIQSPDQSFILPEQEQERMTMLYYLIFLMKSDQQIEEKEEQLIKHFGFKLGFREGLILDFIGLAKKYRSADIPPQEMLANIKKYLN